VYPMNLFAMFPPFPRKNTVFVAMSFEERFEQRWEKVIQPAIRRLGKNNVRLEPVRVDKRKISDSIMTEILLGISHSQFVLADISSIGELNGKPMRNANVMYEVGLAQAVRLPEEVILLRSDDDELLFDVQNIRVHKYSPEDDPKEAEKVIIELILEASKQVELAKSIAVNQTVEKLDYYTFAMLIDNMDKTIEQPVVRTVLESISPNLSTFRRMLDLGLIRVRRHKMTEELIMQKAKDKATPAEKMFDYEVTEFGKAVVDGYMISLGLHELPRSLMESLVADEQQETK